MTDFNDPLKFPLVWHGRLVVFAKAGDISQLIADVFDKLKLDDMEITQANTSSAGTYRTWQLKAEIQDHETLNALFYNLEKLPGVKMLI